MGMDREAIVKNSNLESLSEFDRGYLEALVDQHRIAHEEVSPILARLTASS
jgi:hypothetical protein